MNGRVVVVTGSTQGVGLAIAQAAARAGAEGRRRDGQRRGQRRGRSGGGRAKRRARPVRGGGSRGRQRAGSDLRRGAQAVRPRRRAGQFRRSHRPGIARGSGLEALGAALRGQRASPILSDAAARQPPARARRAGLDRQHPLGARSRRRSGARGLRLDEVGAGRADQERGATPIVSTAFASTASFSAGSTPRPNGICRRSRSARARDGSPKPPRQCRSGAC